MILPSLATPFRSFSVEGSGEGVRRTGGFNKVLLLDKSITIFHNHYMNGLTTVTTKGQVTIPGKIRRALSVKVGDKVYFSKVHVGERQILVKIVSKDTVEKLYGSLNSNKKYTSLEVVRKKSTKKLAKKYDLK